MNLSIFEVMLAIISFLIFVIILMKIFVVPADAQVFPPFVEGPNVIELQTKIRCMPAADFKSILNEKSLHIIALEAQPDNSTKVILTNEIGSVVVANLNNERACILDIMNMADFTNEFHFSKPVPKGNNVNE